MSKLPRIGRIKPRYSPTPNAAERRHEQRLETLPCFGCGRFGVSCHHTLLTFPAKRWRRDHRYQLPLCWECHQGPRGIHGRGNEHEWIEKNGMAENDVIQWMLEQWELSEELERRAA